MMIWKKINGCCDLAEGTLDGAYGWFMEIVSILAIVLVFNFIVKRVLKSLQNHFHKQNHIWKESFVRALYMPLSCYVWFFASVEVACLLIYEIFSVTFLDYKHILLSIAAILAITWFLFRWKNQIVSHMIAKSKKQEIVFDHGKIDMIDKLLTVVIIFFTILMMMEVTGRSFATLIAFGGVGGLAIAFSSQEIIASFFGGMMIYLTHPFGIGDWIVLPEKDIEGYVEEIGWYMTRIRTFEKRPIYVPNAIFTKMILVNPSRMTHRQIKETIGVRYGDLDQIKPVIADIKKMLKSHSDIDQSQAIHVHFTGFGTHSLDILMSAHSTVISNEGFYRVREDILFKVIEILAKNNVELASEAAQTTIIDIPTGIKLVT